MPKKQNDSFFLQNKNIPYYNHPATNSAGKSWSSKTTSYTRHSSLNKALVDMIQNGNYNEDIKNLKVKTMVFNNENIKAMNAKYGVTETVGDPVQNEENTVDTEQSAPTI